MSEFRDFEDRKQAERYALETGLPLGRRVKSPRLRHLLAPYHVGKFSPYHYERIEPMQPKPKYAKAAAVAAKADERLNKRAGYGANRCSGNLADLLEFGKVEVGWRESCGSTDFTMHVYREWVKVIKALQSEGANISEEPVKHGNGWATKGGGFWNSIIYRLEEPTS